jgi:hypothetical protein
MRVTGLSAFAAFLGLHTLGVQGGITCNTDHSLANWSVVNISKLQDALSGPVLDLCNRSLDPGKNEVITHEAEGVIFQITRETTQSAEECKTSFATIIAQCIDGRNVDGGEVDSKSGVVYEIYHYGPEHDDREPGEFHIKARDVVDFEHGNGEHEHDGFADLLEMIGHDSSFEARAPKGGKAKTPKAKPKPAPPKPAPKPKPKPAKPKPTKPKPTPKSKTSSSVKAGPTKTCKQIYALASKPERGAVVQRGFDTYVGGMSHIEARVAAKTTPKKGSACKIGRFNALNYPKQVDLVRISFSSPLA